jgi:hypothetical protein
MSGQHTKEPWVEGKPVKQGSSAVVFIPINEATGIATTNPEDARRIVACVNRIVACVNRCAGMSTAFLEQDVDLFTPKNLLIEQNETLKKKNEDLLIGLRQLMDDCKQSKRLGNTMIYIQKLLQSAGDQS